MQNEKALINDREFQCLSFFLKQSYIYYYIIFMTVPLNQILKRKQCKSHFASLNTRPETEIHNPFL